ncbi:MAG: hydrogenase maturation protease [Kiritimatiellae bacterium]|nr:hydrogenase maturation protease [Kiritimatiellia bacterium]MDD3543848.1 hydrogenase maturation protease [Kiritimatiellia bacterium]MDD4024713.1 hydrogenase maturation protease [Kiritimatiellia bacterium]MDD4621716.1 hydrogenase maturation protease [Kiritimatiellia bacterium]
MLNREGQNALVIGYGNPGRLDDGLGPAFAERVQTLELPGVTVESDYQLNVEDAAEVARYALVLFADASKNCVEPFEITPLKACQSGPGFSSHSISAENLLGLTEALFKVTPRAYMLAVRGYVFDDFGEGLSPQALANLDAAVDYAFRLLS